MAWRWPRRLVLVAAGLATIAGTVFSTGLVGSTGKDRMSSAAGASSPHPAQHPPPPSPAPPPVRLAGPRSAGGPSSAARSSDSAVAWLSVPRLGLGHVPILDRGLDADGQMLIAPGRAVTHYTLSSPLESSSNAVLYGHDDIQGSVFRFLDRVVRGDELRVQLSGGSTRVYRVTATKVSAATDLSVLKATSAPTLTLFTCFPYLVDDHRFVVVAALDHISEGTVE